MPSAADLEELEQHARDKQKMHDERVRREAAELKDAVMRATEQQQTTSRDKYWSELGIEEKLERTREMVKRCQREMHEHLQMMQHHLGEIQRLSNDFLEHSHEGMPPGEVLVRAKNKKQYIEGLYASRGAIASDWAQEKSSDPNQVYF